MKFTYSWLKEHLETEHQYNEVVDKLTAIGLEVESVQDTGLAYKDFIVGGKGVKNLPVSPQDCITTTWAVAKSKI